MVARGVHAAVVGFGLLVIAAVTTIRYRSELKMTQQVFTGLPPAVAWELAAAVFALLYASIPLSGAFKPISVVVPSKGLNTHNFRPDFMTFNHRGTVLPHVLPDGHVLTASGAGQ